MTTTIKQRRRSGGAFVAAAMTVCGAAGGARVARAQAYSFTSLADLTTTAPGGGTFTGFSSPVTSASGGIAFKASTATGSPDAFYYYASPAAPGARIVARGDAAPGVTSAPNATLFNLNAAPVLDNSGNLLFSSSLTGPSTTNDTGLYQYNAQSQTLTTVAIEGQAAPGGGNYGTAFAFRGGAATGGNITFTTTVMGGINTLYAGTASNVVRVLGNGDAAPAGGTFSTFANPNVDAAGRITFSGTTSGNPTTTVGLFATGGGQPTVRLVGGGESVTVPGLSNASLLNPVVLPYANASGFLVFRSNVTGTPTDGGAATRTGIFTLVNGAKSVIAFGGQSAPGGGVYSGAFTPVRVTEGGLGAFRVGLTGTTGDNGIFTFAGSDAGSVSRVLAVGDPLFGSTVTTLGTPSLAENGLLVFEYTLADARAGILTAAVAVPEPGTRGLLASAGFVGAVSLVARRRRRHGTV